MFEKIRSTKDMAHGRLGNKFDLKKFKSLEAINLMVRYADTFLEQLGKGSSRMAFLYSSKYALKIAINEKGLAQNEAEVDVATNPKSKLVIAKIYSADPEYKWVISDLVKPIKSEKEFESLTGTQWEDFLDALYFAIHGEGEEKKNSAFTDAVIATAKTNKLLTGDLKSIEHWGKTPSGRAVLLDYGFTRGVADVHYKKEPEEHITSNEKTIVPGGETPTPGQQATRATKRDSVSKSTVHVNTDKTRKTR